MLGGFLEGNTCRLIVNLGCLLRQGYQEVVSVEMVDKDLSRPRLERLHGIYPPTKYLTVYLCVCLHRQASRWTWFGGLARIASQAGYLMGPPTRNERRDERGEEWTFTAHQARRSDGSLSNIQLGQHGYQRPSLRSCLVAQWSGDDRAREERVPRSLSTTTAFFQRQNVTDPPCGLARPLTPQQRAAGSVEKG
ncbi:hypothetical protein B0I37DRAFT_145896 [Chaetomium sp. MPI-CAGE-AT-0009]|nr:hypothetical protein B0I37DRAFT_145896 [Chaetomium sp. MPI-CAGE-AT-0009]